MIYFHFAAEGAVELSNDSKLPQLRLPKSQTFSRLRSANSPEGSASLQDGQNPEKKMLGGRNGDDAADDEHEVSYGQYCSKVEGKAHCWANTVEVDIQDVPGVRGVPQICTPPKSYRAFGNRKQIGLTV